MCEHKRRCALIGCGPMGLGAALELSRQAEGLNLDLILADRDAARVHQVEARLLALQQESGRQMVQSITPIVGNMHSRSIQQVLKDCDCIITALSWADARPLMEFAIANEIDLAGIGRPLADPRQEWGAVSTATLVVGAGLEPGLAEILARRTVEMFDPGVHLRLYCGGIPHSPRPPMRHISWYGSRLTIDPRPTFRITDGQLEEIERFSGAELINAPKIGVLEAYHDAMLPWITEDELFRNRVASMNQKTVRWPGFATKIRTFHELGLLSETPLVVRL